MAGTGTLTNFATFTEARLSCARSVLKATFLRRHCPLRHEPGFAPSQALAEMARSLHEVCTRISTFNFEGTQKAAFCKEYAVGGMVNVVERHCAYGSRAKAPTLMVEGSTTAARRTAGNVLMTG